MSAIGAPTLWAASARHLLRHPAQLGLALLGLALGVATIVAVDIAVASSGKAFELSMDAVNGAATHEISGGPGGIDEQAYLALRRAAGPIALAPVVEGYVDVSDQTMQLIGVDPLVDTAVRGDTTSLGNVRLEPARADRASTAVPAGGGSAPTVVRGADAPTTRDSDERDKNFARLASGAQQAPARASFDVASRWFTQPGTVVLAASTAQRLGLTPGARFTLAIGGRDYTATLLGELAGTMAGYETLILTDISQAQEWLGLVGKLSRIDVRVPAGAEGERALARLRASLPSGLELHPAQRRTRQSLDMTAAFTTNLQAMSLLALLVGVFLIFSAISFAVVQRRRTIGVLRALGATRTGVLLMILVEAAILGVAGAAVGLLLGIAIGRELVALVSRTINDLYFVVAVNKVLIPPFAIAKALGAGLGVALFAAAVPALEVANSAPQLGLRRSVIEQRAAHASRWLLVAGAVLGGAVAAIVYLSERSLLAGFIALFLLLLAVAAITPAMLRAFARGAARVAGRFSPMARLALGDISASLSRTGVAVSALGLAVAAMIGVSVMVESFRESLRAYLERTIRADLYVTAPGPGFGRPERRLDEGIVAAILAMPAIADHTESRRVVVDSPRGPVPIDALRLARSSYSSIPLTQGDRERVWAAFEQGAIIVSEPLAWHLQIGVGERLTLQTAGGPRDFAVAGVYREYGNDRGNVLMSRATYRELWHDDAITAMGLYLRPGSDVSAAKEQIRAISRGRQSLALTSNADVRALSMRIFDRTFVITRVLYWLTAGVSAIGLVSALLAWELERSRELAIVRALGLTPRGAAAVIEAQTGFMGLAAWLAAIPGGLLTAVLLITVINRRAFGWMIDLHITGTQLANAFAVAMTAALVAGVYPAWRAARAPLASDIREE
ncbi:MAG TPA: FtsX-like permease family protein [Steroidobacteraceae bacterium]|nr:FtsX-like permease family protein [Steroidobacteraceae bacterium]